MLVLADVARCKALASHCRLLNGSFRIYAESNYGPATSRNSNLPLECSSKIRTVRDLEIFKINRRSERGLMTHFMKAVFRPPKKRFNLIHSRLFALAQSSMRTNWITFQIVFANNSRSSNDMRESEAVCGAVESSGELFLAWNNIRKYRAESSLCQLIFVLENSTFNFSLVCDDFSKKTAEKTYRMRWKHGW